MLVVVGMNGEALPDYHGFPARLIVPNIYGMKNVKWLNSIEVVNYQFKGYWQTPRLELHRRHPDLGPV